MRRRGVPMVEILAVVMILMKKRRSPGAPGLHRFWGLTLVEVLASTVLLTLLAATCVPLLRQAMRALHETEPPVKLSELVQFAEGFSAGLAGFEPESLSEQDYLELPWPEEPDRPAITVRRLIADDEDAGHTWLTFTCDRWTVSRWIAVDLEDDIDDVPEQEGSAP